jgi:hypothetical protein
MLTWMVEFQAFLNTRPTSWVVVIFGCQGEFLALEQEDGETCEDVKRLWLKFETHFNCSCFFWGDGDLPK